MTNAYVQWFDSVTRPNGHSNPLAVVKEFAGCALLLSEWSTSAYQDCLCASYAGSIEQYTHVTGQAEATRVSVTLAVEHEHVRFTVQFPKGCKQGGCLAEGEQAGNVREWYGSAHDALLYDLATQDIPDNDTGDAVFFIG